MAKAGRDAVGVLVLDTRFPRVPGDIASARTFGFPVRLKTVAGATQDVIVGDVARARPFLPAFIDAAQELEREGVGAITSSCGFLSPFQDALAASVDIPVVLSSLTLIPLVSQMVGGRPVGVITAQAEHLSRWHLEAAGVASSHRVYVRGMEDSPAFTKAILDTAAGSENAFDAEKIAADFTNVCRRLVEDEPDTAALVLECTNLQPYAAAAQSALGLPIFGIYHAVALAQSGVVNPTFPS
ncbi:MAG: aspartate/glutamate racemase family protein [Alphaproteobacteria bacterium]|nr:aspartate/glutamate racemase family protein [Alphaproteobacteria bacterium]